MMDIERVMEVLLQCAAYHNDVIRLESVRYTFDREEHEKYAKICMEARSLIARLSNGQPT